MSPLITEGKVSDLPCFHSIFCLKPSTSRYFSPKNRVVKARKGFLTPKLLIVVPFNRNIKRLGN